MRIEDSVKLVRKGNMRGGFSVASLHVKVAKVLNFTPILQIMQIVKSTSYVESEG
jgi:hypothetical protein